MSSAKNTSFAKHFALYAASNILVLAAGLVSFPITTRLLTSAEFGVLSYWESGLLLLVAILKFGASDGAIRFYPHHSSNPADFKRYATNILAAPALFGLGGWLLVLAGMGVAAFMGWLDTPGVVFLALAQGLPLAWGALAFRVLQAQEMSALNAVLSVVWRWLAVACTLGALVWIAQSAQSVLGAKLIVHILVIGLLLAWLLPKLTFSAQSWDWAYVKEGLHYGLPLALMELSNIALWYVDRFMMKWLIGDFSVIGIYSIGFALASYIDQLVNTALSQALTPVTTRVYATEGAAAVRAVKLRLLRPLTFVCFAISTGLVIAGTDFLTILASADKASAAPVFEFVGVCFLIRAIIWTAGDGLLLQKRSKTVFVLTLVAAGFNALINLALIPRFGMMGAAYATGISLLGLQLLFYAYCPRDLKVLPQGSVVLKAALAGLTCLLVAHQTDLFGLVNHVARLGATGGLVLVCFGLALLADKEMRQFAIGLAKRRASHPVV